MDVASTAPRVTASALAAQVQAFDTPEALLRPRLAIAAEVAERARRAERLVAAMVVGSTALRRCSARADLDVVLVTPSSEGPDRFASSSIGGVQVETERVGRRQALECTGADGWVWELREAARLGCSVPVYDPDGLAAELRRRAAAMKPSHDRFQANLRDVYLLLIHLGGGAGDHLGRADALRGCLDNLALLALLERPRRYQKAKWALADLLHAGEGALVEAIIASYGIWSDDADVASDVMTGARSVIERVYSLSGIPAHETIIAMGHAPDLAQPSYVSRCLDDAEDLEATGRFVEAQYVAKFAARLAAGLLEPDAAPAGVVDTFQACGGDEMVEAYLALFQSSPEPEVDLMEAALAAADARREALARSASGSEPEPQA